MNSATGLRDENNMDIDLISVGLIAVLLASVPTTWRVLRDGNAADPLRREIEQEAAERRASDRGAKKAV